ncbi:hypothetical protein F5Y03DRAFT_360231 [Xylaria venustula]|nr:hypothetical protein F5Y03DRAFT_360231 [Xylaria venustula]
MTMAETTSPPFATPKRKRDDGRMAEVRLAASPTPGRVAKTVFSFQPPNLQPFGPSPDPIEDGNSSPRSKVVQKFRDLAIGDSSEGLKDTGGGEPESGGGATPSRTDRTLDRSGHGILAPPDLARFNFDAGVAAARADMELDPDDEDAAAVACKRPRVLKFDALDPEPASNPLAVDSSKSHHQSGSADPNIIGALDIDKSDSLKKSHPPINHQADSKPRSRKRTGTPPPSSKRKSNPQSQSARRGEEEELVIVDPVRAALTWQEDEITVYDPDDKDDDGTGINGIGFKPTAAVAYQRAQKRRQQLAEYKKREESEARAKRNQRRRGPSAGGAETTRRHSIVRVHFSDAPPTTVMTT